ncbi:lysophosphatidylserine lipase ABHD12-like [Triplophysa rosa]|uniref:Abhydrolase domain containing 12B n=1 Tax=Triplophysa rosa TaxID=992332 RepID=A0A9W7WNR7_TRIRA|nr:lysophosphatidylserine lipase ABHD12-like [Triplophysa rosa]KAI7805612.1 abhydrolase domain containing 12B [Triplophysa rosa]
MKRRIDKSESKATAAGKEQRTGRHKSKDLNVQSRSQWCAWTKMGFLTLCSLFVTIPFLLPYFSDSVDLSRPSDVGLNYTINIYLKPEEGVRVGVWYTVPRHKWEESKGQDLEWFEKALGDGSPIFIYLHGNAGNRASPPHRIGIAHVLSGAGYHVLAMDYRGFGDSTSEPTERGLTTDTLHLYNWVKARSGNSLVCVWGHSLGSGVATNTAVKLQEQGKHFDGIILEGAFTTGKGGYQHPFTWFYWKFPYIQYFLFNPLKDNILELPSNENLKKIRTPLLILHAEDDPIVPFDMAKELYSIAKNAQKSDKRVKLISFESSLGYVHNKLYKDPRLPDIIREFVQSLMA